MKENAHNRHSTKTGTWKNGRRRVMQWSLFWIVLVVIALGWKYPLLGFSVPVVMITGVVTGFFRGRFVCGNLCPRGAFFDRVLSRVSPVTDIPAWMRGMRFRWVVFVILMGFMTVRILQNPFSVTHWGYVFWQMCTITTAVGVVLGLAIHPRSWCAFCPVGTAQNAVGGGTMHLQLDEARCRSCRLCETVCPMNLPIIDKSTDGTIANHDCLRCRECVLACPVSALSQERTTRP